jgi:hypothetical protein
MYAAKVWFRSWSVRYYGYMTYKRVCVNQLVLRFMDDPMSEQSGGSVVERLRCDGDRALAAAMADYRDQLERMIEVRRDARPN